MSSEHVLGVVLAGGQNRRYGGRHKALELVGGQRIVDRVVSALSVACREVVVVANDLEAYRNVGKAVRADLQPGLGALGGLHTAVCWARDEGREVALVVACDMPFVPSSLLKALADRSDRRSAVVPASESRRGFEPLCGAYGTGCEPAIAAALARGERAIVSFLDDVHLDVLSAAEVAEHGDAERVFLNVNRPDDRQRAERLLALANGITGDHRDEGKCTRS